MEKPKQRFEKKSLGEPISFPLPLVFCANISCYSILDIYNMIASQTIRHLIFRIDVQSHFHATPPDMLDTTRRWDLSIWADVIVACILTRENDRCAALANCILDLQDGNRIKRTNGATTKAMYNLSGPIIHTWDASTKQTML